MSRSPAPLHRAGYRLFPLHKREKIPLMKGWREREHTAEELINYKRAGHNLGVALDDGQVVLDFDPRRGDDREFVELFYGVDLASAPCVKTGGGGWHYYFTVPPGTRLRRRDPAVPGLDIMQCGGLVVAPGSVHPDGGIYEIEGEWHGAPPLDPPVEWHRDAGGDGVREAGDWTPSQLEEYLNQLDPTEWRDYDRWIKMLTACHHATGGDPAAMRVFETWSTSDPDYEDAGPGIEYRWEQARIDRAGAATVATLVYWAEEHGAEIPSADPKDIFADLIRDPDEPPVSWGEVWEEACSRLARTKAGEPKDTLANIRRVVNVWQPHARWATDVFFGRTVTRGRTSFCEPGDQWSDARLLVFRGQLNNYTPTWSPSTSRVHEAVDEIAERHRFHPVVEWLQSLEWDGEDRIDDWVIRYLGCAEPKPGPLVDLDYAREVGRLLLDAMTARVERPGVKYDHMVVLEGEQGQGKSTACRILGGDWFSENAPIGVQVKDAIASMTGVWVFEVGELDALRRSDIRQLKSFLSATGDRARLAYARKAITVPRQCVFLGTTNDRTYLSDETGNRRFLPLPVGDVDMDGLARDRDQLLAEAWAKRTTRPLTLSHRASKIATALQEDRRVVSGTEHILDQYLSEQVEGDYVPALELLTMVGARPNDTHIARQVATLMSARGWEKQRGEGGELGFKRTH